ncbi:MAG: hypothetical protein ABJC89_18795 [Acidobacteriota bacterium]
MSRCSHTHRRTLCFECFRIGMERTRARREAWAQKTLPFETEDRAPDRPLSVQALAHRRLMLDYLAQTDRRRA